jgi:hypothetical protein
MKRFFESFIDSMTMYRLVLYGLSLITLTAFILSLFGQITFGIIPLVVTLAVLLIISYASSKLFAWVFSSPYNPESWKITAALCW